MEQKILELLEKQAIEIADKHTATLLPLLYERFVQQKSLGPCEKHKMLKERTEAEIALTRAKRRYFGLNDFQLKIDSSTSAKENFSKIQAKVLEIRKRYRSLPCTCWETKR